MHISRAGFTPLKGTRHLSRPFVDLGAAGPLGDRVFCLVDLERGMVLRTIAHPSLLQAIVVWEGGVLSVTLPGGTVRAQPEFTGERVDLDYWGRRVAVERVEGPWAVALSAHLGREVALAWAVGGDVVYGASVSMITTGSLEDLSHRAGVPVDDAQFRATFTVHTDRPYSEEGWIGRRLSLGEAEVEVRGTIGRCRVIDLDPANGTRRHELLKTLAGYRRRSGEIPFGVDAVVTREGGVFVGDSVRMQSG